MEAVREPWRLLHAHIAASLGWEAFNAEFGHLPLGGDMEARPRAWLDSLIAADVAPLASSCALLFGAVAAALDLGRDMQAYPDESLLRLEAAVDMAALADSSPEGHYPVVLQDAAEGEPHCIDPKAMWQALFGDLARQTPAGVVAARFHRWLAASVAGLAARIARSPAGARIGTVALTGSCFQNRVLFEETERLLRKHGLVVCTHSLVPPHDGGLALGQAAIGAASLLDRRSSE
jgi:hydrogenase maturation protein HypF